MNEMWLCMQSLVAGSVIFMILIKLVVYFLSDPEFASHFNASGL